MPFPVAGGSCLVCYDYATTAGYVRGLHLATPIVQSHLQQMFANGQRRLSIAVPYFAGGDTFALDSTNGQLTVQDRTNLVGLINLATSIGFVEYVVEMIPEWSAAYTNWLSPTVMGQGNTRAWQPLIYADLLKFTLAVDAAVASTGAFYHMDLLAECNNVEVGRRLWADWCAMKGGADNSLGFSIIPDDPNGIANIAKFYSNGTLPSAFSVHVYQQSWADFKSRMKAAGYYQGFVIGESFCDDPTSDQEFAADSADLFYRFVWPIGRATPANVTQDRLTTAQKFLGA